MLCKKCRTVVEENAKFCGYCGEKLSIENKQLNNKQIKNKKSIFIILGILLVVALLLIFLREKNKIYIDSKKYDLVDYQVEDNEELAKYQLLLYNNVRIYFYNKETKTILDNNSEIIKNIMYGYSYCNDMTSAHGENIKCDDTFDFFELFLHDTGELFVVDKDGYIIDVKKEYDYDKEHGKYDFYYTYFYSNVKIYKENTNNEVYIQEVYDTEGSSIINVIHKDENGKLNKLYEIEDFYLFEDEYIELTSNKINVFKNGKIIKEINKYDTLYDMYQGKYILVKDNNNLKIINLNEQTIVDFGEYNNYLKDAKIFEENGVLYVYEITVDSGYEVLFKFDNLGNFEFLGD